VIFSDVDRLSERERHAAIALADRLLLAGRRVLNHPANVLGRVELLRRLKLSGINPFSLYRLVELANVRSLRYPVFVRTDSEHSGSLSPLIRTPLGLAYWILRKGLRRRSFTDLLIVEYEDVADPLTGVVRRYSYLKIGKRLIARHLLFGHAWMLKYPQLDAPDLLAEEVEFVDTEEPSPLVERVFALAGIDYGRIDFSFRRSDGALCVWEISTNPAHGSRADAMPGRLVMLDRVTRASSTATSPKRSTRARHVIEWSYDRDRSIRQQQLILRRQRRPRRAADAAVAACCGRRVHGRTARRLPPPRPR